MAISSTLETAASHVFEDFKSHASGPRTFTEQALASSLREHYPNHTLTLTSHGGLLELAKAGKAQATLDVKSNSHISFRHFNPPPGRLSSDPGDFIDTVWFGKYDYQWKNHNFIVYTTRYMEGFNEVRSQYVLHKPTSSSSSHIGEDGRDKVVDELIATAAHNLSVPYNEVFVYDQEVWTRSRDLFTSMQGSNWDQVVLDPTLKNALIHDVEGFFSSQSEYDDFAVPWKRGIILHGLPGNGKTISIKAMMNSLYARPDPIPTLYVKSLAGCHGPHYSVREIFVKARKTAPCLLVFEDLDSLISDKVKSFFLNEVDGLESNDGIMMIGSTNYLERLDAGITKRPSRFDRKYHFTLPARPERVNYAKFWRAKLLSRNRQGLDFPEELCETVADLTEDFSFAYLKELFVTSLLSIVSVRRGDDIALNGGEGEEGDSSQKINGTTQEVNGIVSTPAMETSLLGKILQKQVQTLRVELEAAAKSAEEAEKKKTGQDGKGGDDDCEDCVRPFPAMITND